MSLSDDLSQREEIHRAKNDRLQEEIGQLRRIIGEQDRRIQQLDAVSEYQGRALRVPKWLTKPTSKKDRKATLVTILSDTHFDEVVNPSEIDGRNAYNREIAEMRLERYFQQVIRISADYLTGVSYDGAVLMLGGDLVSGDIHEELQDTNAAQTLETVLHWSGQLAAGISLFADAFGRCHVPVVVGNHGRRSRKPRMKGRARDNFDWMIGQLLARHFDGDPRITFQIPDGTDAMVEIHDTRLLLTHGDQVSGGGGIGGIWPPVMRMIAKKRVRYSFDAVVMGHWHSLLMAPSAGVVVNGSLKGEDEYASIMGFAPERAQQACFTVAPEHGVTFSAPVFCDDRKKEGW